MVHDHNVRAHTQNTHTHTHKHTHTHTHIYIYIYMVQQITNLLEDLAYSCCRDNPLDLYLHTLLHHSILIRSSCNLTTYACTYDTARCSTLYRARKHMGVIRHTRNPIGPIHLLTNKIAPLKSGHYGRISPQTRFG